MFKGAGTFLEINDIYRVHVSYCGFKVKRYFSFVKKLFKMTINLSTITIEGNWTFGYNWIRKGAAYLGHKNQIRIRIDGRFVLLSLFN